MQHFFTIITKILNSNVFYLYATRNLFFQAFIKLLVPLEQYLYVTGF
jgi:hypothetical protein